MIINADLNGNVSSVPSTIPAGTVLKEVVIITPYTNASVVLRVTPPSQVYIPDIVCTPTITDSRNVVWIAQVPREVSASSGRVTYQLLLTTENGEGVPMQTGTFNVSRGVITDMPESAGDLSEYSLEQIYTMLASVGTVYNMILGVQNTIQTYNDSGVASEELYDPSKTLIGAINELDALLRYRTEEGTEKLYEIVEGNVGYNTNTIVGRINVVFDFINRMLPIILAQYAKNKNFVDLSNNFTDHKSASAVNGETEDKEDPHNTKQAISIAKNEIISSYISPIQAQISAQAQLINRTAAKANINQQDILTVNTKVHQNSARISSVESQLSGVARSFALPDFASFISFMNGESTITVGDSTVGVWNLVTGDNVFLIEHNTADFWYQQTSDVSGAEKYTYNGVEYTLIAKNADGASIGLMHVAESDYNVIEGQVVSAQQSANEAKAAAEETDADRVAIQTLVNSIFYIQKAPTLEHINDAVMLPTPTLAMLPDGMV